jgi:hypothetical protein
MAGITSTPKRQIDVSPIIESSFVKPRAGMDDGAARAQMASDMREASSREGGITREGLELLGWTSLQIDRHASAARIKAQALSGMTA